MILEQKNALRFKDYEIDIRLSNMESLIEENKDEEYVSKCVNYYSKLISAKTYNEIKYSLDSMERLSLPTKSLSG